MKQKRLSIHRGLQGLWLLAALLLLAPTGLRAQDVVSYDLWICGTQVTSENADNVTSDNLSTVSFDAATNTLTLNGASLSGVTLTNGCIVSGLSELTINVVGDNTLNVSNDSCTAIRAVAPMSQTLAIKATGLDNSLTITGSRAIRDFTSVTLSGLCWNDVCVYKEATTASDGASHTGNQLVVTDSDGADNEVGNVTLYPLTVMYQQVTSQNASNIFVDSDFEGGAAFDATTNTLTLNGIDLPGGIVSGLDALTIELTGSNTLSAETAFCVMGNGNNTLTIAKNADSETTCSLALTSYTIQSVIGGFASVNYDGLYLHSETSGCAYDANSRLFLDASGAPVTKLQFSSAEHVYDLWYGDTQITSENQDDILNGDGGRVTFGYDADKKRYVLTLDNATLTQSFNLYSVATINPLYINLIGDSQINMNDNNAFLTYYSDHDNEYNPEVVESASAVFTTSSDSPATLTYWCMYNLRDMTSAFENGIAVIQSSVNGLNGVETPMIIGSSYGLTIKDNQGTTYAVSAINHENVLGDNGSVKFDGHNTLLLNGASLQNITVTTSDELKLFLIGDNTISDGAHAIDNEGGISASLTIETACNNPGSLTMSADRQLLNGFGNAEVKQPLAILSTTPEGANSLLGTAASLTAARIGVPLGLIIDNVAETAQDVATDIDYSNPTGDNARVANGALTNVVINNVLYTLNDTQTAEVADDGYDNGRIVLNSTMTDAAVETLNGNVEAGTLVPGTDAYASAYNGLTFIVPAGTGTITLETETAADREFHLKVGAQDPVVVVNKVDNNGNAFALDYAVSKSTYVYLYLTAKTTANAPKKGPHRIGPKSGVGGGLGSLGVSSSASAIAGAVTAPSSYLMCTSSMVARSTSGGITVDNAGVTDIDASVFSGGGSHAPRRALYDGVPYVDLSKTSIIGKEISRTSGAFAGFPEETLIYVPAGNTTTEKNVIIGTICDHLLLNGSESNTKTFEFGSKLATFTAAKATLDRTFEVGKTATVYVPFDIAKPTDFGTFSTVTAVDTENMTVTLSPAATVTANTAYVFEPTATKLEVKTVTVKKPAGSSSAKLLGTYSRKDYVPNMYCYAAQDEDESDIKKGDFVRMGTGSYVPPFRAYMLIDSAAPVFSVIWSDSDMSTGVAPMVNVQSSKFNGQWYTLDGRRLASQPTAKGIYVNNGRKVVIK